MKNRITINGVAIEVEGSNVSCRNGIIYVDGFAVCSVTGNVHIQWDGDLASLEADGSVECQNVQGNVTAGGSVRCGEISGHATAGGSVRCSGRAVTPRSGNHIVAGGSVHIH